MRRRLSERLSNRFRSRFRFVTITREGKRFLLATTLIAVAAFNTGNNLIFLILALMLSFNVLAFVFAWVNLRGIEIILRADPPVFAGERSAGTLTLMNSKRIVPSLSIRVHSPLMHGPVYVASVPAGTMIERDIPLLFRRRGSLRYGDFTVSSGFPFILLERKVTSAVAGNVLVYPQRITVDHLVRESSLLSDSGMTRRTASGDDIFSLREFHDGDDRRNIHWKASAKTASLLVKEYALNESRNITVFLDTLLPAGGTRFERAVAIAASLCELFLHRGDTVRMITCQKMVPYGQGNGHLYAILDVLAIIGETDCRSYPRTEEEGISIMVLKSHDSLLKGLSLQAGAVVYADSV